MGMRNVVGVLEREDNFSKWQIASASFRLIASNAKHNVIIYLGRTNHRKRSGCYLKVESLASRNRVWEVEL